MPRRLSPAELDTIALRLQEIELEDEELRLKLLGQVQEFGSTPARAEKSKRLQTTIFQFTASTSSSTEVHDAEVERIRQACPDELFSRLFVTVKKYKLAKEATLLLAGTLPENAPRNLRMMFSRAVEVKESGPRLRIEKLVEVEA
jgi:hypothetical protein